MVSDRALPYAALLPVSSTIFTKVLRPLLSICALLTSDLLIQLLKQAIGGDLETCCVLPNEADQASLRSSASDDCRYTLNLFNHEREFLDFVREEKRQIECLVLQDAPDLPHLLAQLQQTALLPTLILEPAIAMPSLASGVTTFLPEAAYHRAILRLSIDRLGQFDEAVDEVIDHFLQLAVNNQNLVCDLESAAFNPSLLLQQHRLAEKLKERLGYLSVYYKRNPQNFFRRMSQERRQAFLQQLKADYREIVLVYFLTKRV